MLKHLMAGAALALVAVSGAASAQDGAQLDCVPGAAPAALKSSIGQSMTSEGDEAKRNDLFEQLGKVVDDCAARHEIGEANKGDYFDYSLARISRDWLTGDISKAGLSTAAVDKALDFGPGKTNPDLSQDMTDEQIMTIVQAYIDSGVDIEKVDSTVWEKVGAYAAATSIYWNKRKSLPF